MLRGVLRRENPTYTYWSLQRGVVLKWFLRPTAVATRGFTMVSFTEAVSRRNTFVGGTCATPSALLVLYGTALKHTARLHRVRRALARVVVNQRSRPPFSSNALLKQLHWLPLEWRIRITVQTRHLNFQRIAYWSPTLSH